MKKPELFVQSRQKKLLKFSLRLKKKLESGTFGSLPESQKRDWVNRVVRLRNRLSGNASSGQLARAMSLSAVTLGMLAGTAYAQPAFNAPVDTPFGFDTQMQNITICGFDFADLDGDGDLDGVLLDSTGYGSFEFRYLENTGSATSPAFSQASNNILGGDSLTTYAFPAMADLDGDGDIDFLYVSYDYGLNSVFFGYRQNTGTASNPQFAPTQVNPFGLTSDSAIVEPSLVDLDGDGDMDLMMGTYDGDFRYYENTGSSTAPAFSAGVTNPFGLTSVNYLNLTDFVDLDGDGDQDILAGEEYGALLYYENTGTVNAPSFAAPLNNPFGLTSGYYHALPVFADLDGDGDQDLMVNQYAYYGTAPFIYFENTEIIASVAAPLPESEWQVFPNPSAGNFVLEIAAGHEVGATGVEVINGIGQVVYEDQWQVTPLGFRREISLKGHPAGMYFVRLDNGNTPVIKKLMIR